MRTPHVVRVGDEAEGDRLKEAVECLGGRLEHRPTIEGLIVGSSCSGGGPDLVVLDHAGCDGGCRGAVMSVRGDSIEVGLMVRLGAGDEIGAAWLLEAGADDVIGRGTSDIVRLVGALSRVLRRVEARRGGRSSGSSGQAEWGELGWIRSEDRCGRALGILIDVATRSNRSVLIEGETGTGKSRLARWIHGRSAGAGPMVEFRVEGRPDSVVETLLFRGEGRGHAGKGSESRAGAVDRARGGTLILEEISALPRGVQVELSRRLDELGSVSSENRFRLIATNSVALEPLVHSRQFCGELLARMSSLRIALPPLRERRNEIGRLAECILKERRGHSVPPVERISVEALRLLTAHDWPGNVRELEEVLEYAIGLARESVIRREELPAGFGAVAGLVVDPEDPIDVGQKLKPLLASLMSRVERAYLERLLGWYRGRVPACAEHARMTRRVLGERLRKHGLDPKVFEDTTGEMTGPERAGYRQLLLAFDGVREVGQRGSQERA